MARDKFAAQSLGNVHAHIKKARVLMVGAGGIGCELLKNLVLTGFGEIHVVDLDTIDLSNLNRQFLFRNEHIKKSKANVAKESAGKFNPNVNIVAYHDNIKGPQFNVAWFKTFEIVFNALDNLDARRHVNKMCLAANVPLIESGTTGFNGQVQVIKKGETECYDCTPKDPPKSFPVCTIRSTPSQPIHCIVWAKSYLFAEMFGATEDEAPELDHSEDSENAKEVANLRKEAQALSRLRKDLQALDHFEEQSDMESESFPADLFDKVFNEDIERLLSMEDMWKNKRAPQPLIFEDLADHSELMKQFGGSGVVACNDQEVWSVEENCTVYLESLRQLSNRLVEMRKNMKEGDAPPMLTFDKDDEDALDFVAATANLRAHIFGIEMRSKFDIKQMAGNIIPAIATTNAMTASLCVLSAFKILRNQISTAKFSFLTRSIDRVIASESLQPPNPHCATCGVQYATLVVDTKTARLSDLVDLLQAELGYSPDFSIKKESDLLYDVDEEIHLGKTFEELGLKADTFITIFDEAEEEAKVDLLLCVIEKESTAEGEKALLLSEKVVVPLKPKKPEVQTNGHAVANGNANGKMDATMHATNGATKRKAGDADLDEEIVKKKGKVREEKANDDDIVIIEDDGAIVLD